MTVVPMMKTVTIVMAVRVVQSDGEHDGSGSGGGDDGSGRDDGSDSNGGSISSNSGIGSSNGCNIASRHSIPAFTRPARLTRRPAAAADEDGVNPIADGICVADALQELSDLVSLALSSALATHPVVYDAAIHVQWLLKFRPLQQHDSTQNTAQFVGRRCLRGYPGPKSLLFSILEFN
ncbi:hypothetical protein DFH08DRAFT_814536 [Mycena albidolilacea]|uniref:Uncharacterized protein n=1 Tax=Mycena albidolilacea TaxID=1033008 RepID=A0AAD6ZPG4_9AGAR|nr:hypothetical protein DFH08DRAFT_814536 [Mycena albidolilacea]